MERSQILLKVQDIFRDILEQDELILHGETTSAQVKDWDSLNHIHLVTAIEKHFKIRFLTREIQSWKKVDDLIESITNKLK